MEKRNLGNSTLKLLKAGTSWLCELWAQVHLKQKLHAMPLNLNIFNFATKRESNWHMRLSFNDMENLYNALICDNASNFTPECIDIFNLSKQGLNVILCKP